MVPHLQTARVESNVLLSSLALQIICGFDFSVPRGRVVTKSKNTDLRFPVQFSIYIAKNYPLLKLGVLSPPLFSFQNTFLQETVRRECEERFELTEALSQAREQLLELRKHSGSVPLSPCFPRQGSLTSSAAAVSNQGERSTSRLNSEKGIKIPSLRGVSKPTLSPPSAQPKRANSSGLPTVLQPHPPRGRASSVSKTRQRLAALLWRLNHQ